MAEYIRLSTNVYWDTANTYQSTITTFLTPFTVSLIVWDNSGALGRTIKYDSIKTWESVTAIPKTKFWVVATKSSITYLLEINIVFQTPLDSYKTYKDVPKTFWATELGTIDTYLMSKGTVIEGIVS